MAEFRKKLALLVLCSTTLVVGANYLTGAILPAFKPSNSDFSELYATSWLWLHGQDPYDSALATGARQRVVGGADQIYLVNVPTALVLISPFVALPWGWANFAFLLLGIAGVIVTARFFLRSAGNNSSALIAAFLIAFVLSFSPLRIAFQWGNIVLLVFPLSILAIELAQGKHEWEAGIVFGLVVCLKPQIGVWPVLYYLLRGRFKLMLASVAVGVLTTAGFFLQPIQLEALMASYRLNVQHWFGLGGLYGFTEGSAPSLLLRTQGVLYQVTRRVTLASWLAQALFIGGLAAWAFVVWRGGRRIPAPLAIASLWSLSFLSFYHSIPDASILTLCLCDAFPLGNWTRNQKLAYVLLFLMMLPERTIFVFLNHHLNRSITHSWWWQLFLVRHFAWLLLGLSLVLILRMYEVHRRGKDLDAWTAGLTGVEAGSGSDCPIALTA